MKKLLILLFILIISSMIFADDAKKVINNKDINQSLLLKQTFEYPNSTVVAEINGIKITKGELMYELWKSQANSVLDILINQKVLDMAFEKEGVKVTPADIDKELKNLQIQYKVSSIDEFLQKANMSYDELVKTIKINIGMQKYVDKTFKLDKEKLANYYKPSHILIKFDSKIENEIQRDEACKKKIDEIYAKVKAGEDFAKLAKEYSEDGSKAQGGSLGWVDNKVNFVPTFKDAMLKLKPGEYTEPVKTEFGYHIIKMDAKGDTAPEAEIKDLIAKEKSKQSSVIIRNWYSQIKNDMKINNYLVPVITPKALNVPAQQPKDAPKTDASKVETK